MRADFAVLPDSAELGALPKGHIWNMLTSTIIGIPPPTWVLEDR
jgi:hypothetical protein